MAGQFAKSSETADVAATAAIGACETQEADAMWSIWDQSRPGQRHQITNMVELFTETGFYEESYTDIGPRQPGLMLPPEPVPSDLGLDSRPEVGTRRRIQRLQEKQDRRMQRLDEIDAPADTRLWLQRYHERQRRREADTRRRLQRFQEEKRRWRQRLDEEEARRRMLPIDEEVTRRRTRRVEEIKIQHIERKERERRIERRILAGLVVVVGIVFYAAVAFRAAIGRAALMGLVEVLASSVRLTRHLTRRLSKGVDTLHDRVKKRLND